MKTGLVLEGGGMRGLYTAGVLDAMMEHGITFDGVIGVSAGAIHGCSFVSKQKGRSLRYYKKYCNDPQFMSFRSLLKTGDFVGADFCYHELPNKLDLYDYDAFNASSTDFYVVCTDIESGEPLYKKMNDMYAEIDYLRASASLPYISRIVALDGKKYLDGAIADSIPLKAFQDMGYDRNVVILTRPLNYRKGPEKSWLVNLFYRKYPKFAKLLKTRHVHYNEAMESVHQLEKAGNIFVIRPSVSLNIGRLENDPSKIQGIYDAGYRDGINALEDMKKYLE